MFDTNRTFLERLRQEPHRLMHVQGSALPFLPAAVVHLVDALYAAVFQRASCADSCAACPRVRVISSESFAAQRSDPRRNTPCGGDVILRGLVGPNHRGLPLSVG